MTETSSSFLEGPDSGPLPGVKRREQFQVVHFKLTEAFNHLNSAFYTVGAMADQPMDPSVSGKMFDVDVLLADALGATRRALEQMDHIIRKLPSHG